MRERFRLHRWCAVFLVGTMGCSAGYKVADASAAPQSYGGAFRGEGPAMPPMDMEESDAGAKMPANESTSGNIQSPAGPQTDSRKPILIYRADFTMGVYEVEKSLNAVDGIAKESGGYMSRRDDNSITIRVPADKFHDVVAAIEKVGDVVNRNVVSEDVTAEYRDLEVQLQNQLALRDRFEKLLEKAAKVEEALAIERELGRITGEIERIKGRLKLLSDLARYSTITVTFAPKVTGTVQSGPFTLPLPWLNDVGLRRLMNL